MSAVTKSSWYARNRDRVLADQKVKRALALQDPEIRAQRRERERAYYAKNRLWICARIAAQKIRCKDANQKQAERRRIKHTYGITPEQFDALVTAQNNRCAICAKEMIGRRDRHIDHDHDTLRVRGILCRACNIGIGLLDDSPSRLRLAIRYLEGL